MEMAFELARIGPHHVLLWLHTKDNPTAERWDAAIDAIAAARSAGIAVLPGLVFTDGGAPNAAQRKSLQVVDKSPMAVMTTALTNPVLRGIATALRWAYPAMSFFDPRELQQGLVHTGLVAYSDEVLERFSRLQATLPAPVHALQLARTALGR